MIERPILHGALFVSLALNVFVGGAFVGAHLQQAKTPVVAAPAVARAPLVMAVRGLPPEAQAAWRETNPDYARAYGPKVREARRLSRQAMLSFGDEPFDPRTTLETLSRARALEHEARTAQDQRIVTFAATLPQAERKAFGEALARPRLGGGRAGQGDRGALADR